jgi:transcriptional regulator with XRE-family HTH domain
MEMIVGEIIKKLRIEKGYTQNELAIMLGLKLSTMQKYESGAILNIKLETIRELCHIFEVPSAVFIFPEYVKYSTDDRINEIYNDEDIRKCMNLFVALNSTGKSKVIEYMSDLISNTKYNRTNNVNT